LVTAQTGEHVRNNPHMLIRKQGNALVVLKGNQVVLKKSWRGGKAWDAMEVAKAIRNSLIEEVICVTTKTEILKVIRPTDVVSSDEMFKWFQIAKDQNVSIAKIPAKNGSFVVIYKGEAPKPEEIVR